MTDTFSHLINGGYDAIIINISQAPLVKVKVDGSFSTHGRQTNDPRKCPHPNP